MENKGQREELQNTINRVVEWSLEWQMTFMDGAALEVVKYERDLGSRCTGARANGILGQQLSRAVSYRDRIPCLKLYKVYVEGEEGHDHHLQDHDWEAQGGPGTVHGVVRK